MVCTRWAWIIWVRAASQGAQANACAFGGIIYSRHQCDGPAAAQYLARQRRRRPCGSNYCAMASTARSIHRSGTALSTPAQSRRLIKKTDSAYPRPRARRLSRKTRAAAGKPPRSTTLEPAVSRADSPGATLADSDCEWRTNRHRPAVHRVVRRWAGWQLARVRPRGLRPGPADP